MRTASLIAVAALALAAPAAAADSLQVGRVDTSDYPTTRYSVVTPTPSSTAPTVLENGEPVVGFAAENLGRTKSIALLIDRSRSMNGAPLQNAVSAARSFIASKPPADRVMLIGFGRQAVRLTGFSVAKHAGPTERSSRSLLPTGMAARCLRSAGGQSSWWMTA